MEKEKLAPSMYEITKIWYEGKESELWREIHAEYYKDAAIEYIAFIDWLIENYETPKRK